MANDCALESQSRTIQTHFKCPITKAKYHNSHLNHYGITDFAFNLNIATNRS